MLSSDVKVPEGGHNAGDHPPITPMALAREGELSGDYWRLYDYISRHFVASLMNNQQYLRTKVTFSSKETCGETFVWSGNQILKPGFTAVFPWKDSESQSALPATVEQGEAIELVAVRMKEGKTTPPSYLTESDLIGLMEKLGIGTDASMAVHINNICERRYVQIQSNQRMLVPTNLGIVLIHG